MEVKLFIFCKLIDAIGTSNAITGTTVHAYCQTLALSMKTNINDKHSSAFLINQQEKIYSLQFINRFLKKQSDVWIT